MKYLSCAIAAFLLSCTPTVPLQNPQDTLYARPSSEGERTEDKVSDPVKQKKCSESGSICQGNDQCEKICDDLFTRRNQREDCEKLPRDMVFDFEDLIESVEDGNTDDIKAKTLECLLDIDDKKFSKAIKKLTRTQVKEFLLFIAEDEEIARIFKDEDDEFIILKQLFSKISGSDLDNVITREIEDGKNFLHLASEGNDSAYQWIDRYVEDQCNDRNSQECPSGESIGAYCKALLTLSSRDLTDFLDEANLFSDVWQDEFDNNNFRYDRSGFIEFCKYAQAGALSTDCPDDSPHDSFKLADITLVTHNSDTVFYPVGLLDSVGDTTPVTASNRKGSSDPAQDILRGIQKTGTKIWLDETEINKALYRDEFDEDAKWYLYMGDDNRHTLDHSDKYNASGVKYHVFTYSGGDSISSRQYEVWLAYEDTDGNCRYVQKP